MLRHLHWFRLRPVKPQKRDAGRPDQVIGTSYWLARRRDDHQEVWSHLGLLIWGAENREKKPKSKPPETVTRVFFMPAFWTSA